MLWGFLQWSNIWACAGIRGEDKSLSRNRVEEEKKGAAKFSNFSPIHGTMRGVFTNYRTSATRTKHTSRK